MTIEATLVELIAAVNECTAAIRENTASKGLPEGYSRVTGAVRADANQQTTQVEKAAKSNPAAAQQTTPLADIPPTTYEEVAKLFAAVYANGAHIDDALAAIAPLPHLKDIKAKGEQHPGQLAALKGKLLAAAQKVGALV